MPPVGPRLGVWGGESDGALDRNPGKEFFLGNTPTIKEMFQWSPR